MEEFIQEFKAEATSILDRLQEQLLLLAHEKETDSIIEEIFRGIHTLKGSSRMFGFENIEAITHQLENTYDTIRNGLAKPTKVVVDLSLAVVDMATAILNGQYDENEYILLLKRLGSEEVFLVVDNREEGIYQILYFPKENIYARGVNPIAAIDEFRELGAHVFTLKEPLALSEQEKAKKFSSAFEIIVAVKGGPTVVEDVLLFMDQQEFEIHLLDAEKRTWTDVINRAQRVAGRNFSEAEIQERNDVLALYFKRGTALIPETVKVDNSAKKLSTGRDTGVSFINVKLERLDEMMNLVSELVTIKSELNFKAGVIEDRGLLNIAERLDKVTTRFRDNAFTMRLVPLQILSLKFQRMTLELGEKLGKHINVLTEGLNTEIDKTIITEIEAPLMHIIRNAIDHGLETTEERRRLGKNEKGLLKIVAFYAGANVFIQIQDDGRGLNLKKIREKAISRGIISETTILTEKEIINLIFEPGFSTHDKATEYSGRGVGMDVVKQKLKSLRGSIEITTEEGLGTAFTLRLPLSLSILDVLHLRVNDVNYLVPHTEVQICVSERLSGDIMQRKGNNLKFNGQLIPFIQMREIVQVTDAPAQEPAIVVINKNEKSVAIEVDEIVGKEQLVIKPVDEAFKHLQYLSGIAVLGNGELAFLIDCLKLNESFSL